MQADNQKKEEKQLEIIPGCIVCKTCEFHAPDIFIVEEKAFTARVLVEQPSPERMKDVREAIKMCPEHVITYKLASTKNRK